MDPMVVTTMAEAIAVLAMLAEFRVNDVSAETIPYRDRSTALSMELLFGEPNMPEPTLWSTNTGIIRLKGELSVSLAARINSASDARANPPTLNFSQPNRSDSLPLMVPMTVMAMAAGKGNQPGFPGAVNRAHSAGTGTSGNVPRSCPRRTAIPP